MAELWFYRSDHCGACRAFEREVGDRYARTDEGREVPLQRIDFTGALTPALTGSSPVLGTPTFVLAAKGREWGRITGYSNDELFWMRLTAILATLPERPKPLR